MEKVGVLVLVGAYLPALIPLFSLRIIATLFTALVCTAAIFALPFFVFPGIILWFIALFIGISSANNAKRDRQHNQLIRAISAGQLGAGAGQKLARKAEPVVVRDPALEKRAHLRTDPFRREPTVSEIYKGVQFTRLSGFKVKLIGEDGDREFDTIGDMRMWVDRNETSAVDPSILGGVRDGRASPI